MRAKVTGKILDARRSARGSVPALLWLLDAARRRPVLARSTRRSAAADPRGRQAPAAAGEPAAAAASWCSRTCTGSTPRPRRCSTPSSRACRRRHPARGELPAGVSARLGRQELLPAAPHRRRCRRTADELLRALLGDDAGAAAAPARCSIERTEGNPLFLEESVRALVETGVLVGERGAYRLGKRPATIQMPATVQAILAARIDRLPAERQAPAAGGLGDRQGRAAAPLLEPSPSMPEDDLRERAGAAAGGRVPLRGAALPRPRVHLQARAHPRGGVRQPAARPAARAARPDRRRDRARSTRTG